tara:strand:- start:4429 stop:5571 length:1143 start_codon:yes stop_codon:yes gene_type:complete
MNLIPYAGNQYGLKFPVLCDGYVSVDYSDNIASEARGIWDHEGSFTVEVLFIPYDVNGYGSNSTGTTTSSGSPRPYDTFCNGGFGNQTSQKTMPSRAANISTNTDDILYMPVANRLNHRMCLFSSTNFKLYLINNTTSSVNQPAEYYFEAKLTTGVITSTVRTPVLIKARNTHAMNDGDPTLFSYTNNLVNLIKTNFTGSQSVANNKLLVSDADSNRLQMRLENGQTLYKSDGTVIGVVQSLDATSATSVLFIMDRDVHVTCASSTDIYLNAPKEITYPLSTHHVGVSYNKASNSITIFYNGAKVSTIKHTDTNTFSFGSADITLGQDRTSTDNKYSQFMGELHEVAVIRGSKTSINTTSTLLPQFNETLLYIDFEEADI